MKNICGFRLLIAGAMFIMSATLGFANTSEVSSPNSKISVILKDAESSQSQNALFSVKYKSEDGKKAEVFSDCTLGLKTDKDDFFKGLKLVKTSAPKKIVEKYKMISGKRSQCFNSAYEKIFTFKNEGGRELEVIVRAYNDGVAIKYLLNATDGENITDELTSYNIANGKTRWLSKYEPRSYEDFYEPYTDCAKLGETRRWGYPILAQVQENVFSLISEADIKRGDCGSFLENKDAQTNYKVCLADQKIPTGKKWESPWRLMIVGALSDIVESTLVSDLSSPCKLKDISWIKGGAVSWIYWANNNGSNNFEIVKSYIDNAADMGWKYDLIDWNWNSMSNGGDIYDAVKYARKKDVGLMLWYNSSTALLRESAGPLYKLNDPKNRAQEFEWLNKNGIVGIKVDFFDGDTAKTMNYYIDILEDAAKHKIMVIFHGATIPRGWQRTYPNLMTTEAVYGAEWYNNNSRLTNKAAAHNSTLVFTRNVVGSMDYTPATFSDSQHKHITSHAHELALTVLFESSLQHMPDRPSSYQALPEKVRAFLSVLPTTWDDTKLLSGYPQSHAIIARRKGNVWYIAGINATNEPITLKFNLEKLKISPSAQIEIFKDAQDDKHFAFETLKNSESKKEIAVQCLPRGGFTAVIK